MGLFKKILKAANPINQTKNAIKMINPANALNPGKAINVATGGMLGKGGALNGLPGLSPFDGGGGGGIPGQAGAGQWQPGHLGGNGPRAGMPGMNIFSGQPVEPQAPMQAPKQTPMDLIGSTNPGPVPSVSMAGATQSPMPMVPGVQAQTAPGVQAPMAPARNIGNLTSIQNALLRQR